MSLDRAEGPAGLGRDLVEAQIAKEAQGDDLAIRLVEPRDGRPDAGGALGTERADRWILPAGQIDTRDGVGWVDPCDVVTTLRPAKGNPHGDPGDPGAERPVAAPTGEAPEGGHECLLGGIFGLMEIAEDAMAGSDDSGRFAVDEDPERIPIAGQDSLDSGAFIGDLGVGAWG
jgi:hypothetical protein